MIVLDNECILHTKILCNDKEFVVKKDEEVEQNVQGIGVITDDEELVGVYLQNQHVYFLDFPRSIPIDVDSFNIINEYISNAKRKIEVYNQGKIIYQKIYEPYIDPGIIIYDSDEDEFDALLRFAKMFFSADKTKRIIQYIRENI